LAVRRKIEDERDAVRCLRAAERRGLSTRDWARAHGVDGRSLHAWQMNLARRGTAPVKRRKRASGTAAHALIELVPTPAPVAAGPGRYALVVGGARVEFGDDASVTTLRRVLEALRSC
jgi:hypothetical protein